MLSKLTQFAKQLLSRLATAANRLFRRITEPARSNIVTATLADSPRRCSELLAENALLRQPVATIFFKTLYAFVIVHLGSRRVVHVNVTDHPSDAWVAQQLREATPFGDTPKHLICDNDKKYGPEFDRVAKTSRTDVFLTPYQARLANSICERYRGSLKRECLDHVLVLGVRQLVRVLMAFMAYFNRSRPHTGTPRRTPA